MGKPCYFVDDAVPVPVNGFGFRYWQYYGIESKFDFSPAFRSYPEWDNRREEALFLKYLVGDYEYTNHNNRLAIPDMDQRAVAIDNDRAFAEGWDGVSPFFNDFYKNWEVHPLSDRMPGRPSVIRKILFVSEDELRKALQPWKGHWGLSDTQVEEAVSRLWRYREEKGLLLSRRLSRLEQAKFRYLMAERKVLPPRFRPSSALKLGSKLPGMILRRAGWSTTTGKVVPVHCSLVH
ncbi:MAG: hypothetical protein C5B49_00850 [Bdellovibrio sp.]|nr:MAG: hypothetical protein C5B49_00850 [Bdellovibrio sp.]